MLWWEAARCALWPVRPEEIGQPIPGLGLVVTAKAQRLTVHVSPDLPPALCDETRAAQIVGNLLSNAIKYTLPGGLITITLVLAEEEGFLQLSVVDNGVGISAEDQAKLFRRFFRAESARLAETNGLQAGCQAADFGQALCSGGSQ